MSRLFLVARVASYRRLARELIGPEDVVIELGSADGLCTRVLARRAQRVIAIERNRAASLRTRDTVSAFSNVVVLCQDAFELKPVLGVIARADAVFVDVGGAAPIWKTMRLAANYWSMFLPRVLVVRNTRLASFISALEWAEPAPSSRYWSRPEEAS